MKKFVAILFLITTIGCQNYQVQSEEVKQEKIATLYRDYAQEFPLVEGITAKELQDLKQQSQKIVLVDVRSPEERAVSIIPGAISTEEFESNLEKYENDLVIAYCTIGYRSGIYANQWRERGVKILNLEGSLLSWSHIQGKLINAQGVTKKVHVFARQWHLTADEYQAIW